MEMLVIGQVALLLAALAVAFGFEWLGLWMSKQPTSKEIVRGRERTQRR